MATGDEILIVDASERDREGMRRLFDEDGYICTALASTKEAREFREKEWGKYERVRGNHAHAEKLSRGAGAAPHGSGKYISVEDDSHQN